ncbi:PREDICTED: fatty acid synthase-like [Wasmannia auropunctata]|uniref:fatty acid synthase-like n=1 Tax=Wasmannia auropunctata TaxID=64793 RepID=UPI0005EF711F|nr:PREDICTED: fatty acid synthase-like [Wasmannia auropunctata]
MISYHFDLKGPSYVVDTACSSSLYALAIGYDFIMSGICDDAIIGSANFLIRNKIKGTLLISTKSKVLFHSAVVADLLILLQMVMCVAKRCQ